ncbi:MAG: hypothetical protein ACR2LX_13140 [Jatrophihabitans sp.]
MAFARGNLAYRVKLRGLVGRVTTMGTNRLDVTVSGATRSALEGLCTTAAVSIRPVVVAAVRGSAGGACPGEAPQTDAAFQALPRTIQTAIRRCLAAAHCPATTHSAKSGPICDLTGEHRFLLGNPLASEFDVALLLTPASRSSNGIRFSLRGDISALESYTSAHNTTTTGQPPTGGVESCGQSFPCSDYLADVVNDRAVVVSYVTGEIVGKVEITGLRTKGAAITLADQVTSSSSGVHLSRG